MSDGDHAAPDRRRPLGPDATGGHSEGVAAADLIARLTGNPHLNPVTRRRVGAPDPAGETVPIPVGTRAADLPDLSGPGPDPHPGRTRRRVMVAGRLAAALIAITALAVTGSAWQWQSAKNRLLNTIAALDPNSSDIRDPGAQTGDENFLIIGVDSRIGENGQIGAGDTTIVEGARPDTIMLVNVPRNRQRVVAVSFPRDLQIAPMNCQAWDPETGRYGPVYDKNTGEWSDNERPTTTKLNSAYALGGPKCLVKVIQKISGLAINRFMAVDFVGFSRMVDALGGVEVCSATPLEDAVLGTVLATAGRQTLDGQTALNYVRARSVTTGDNSDYGRIKRQQLFLSSLLRSIISTETLFDLNKLDDVVNVFIEDSYVDNVRTKDLVALGQSLQGVNAGRITFVTVPTTGEVDYEGNEIPRTEDVRALFDAIIDDQSLPGENDNNETLSPLATGAFGSITATPSMSGSWSALETSAAPTTTVEEVKAVAADPRDVTVAVADPDGLGMAATAAAQFDLYGFSAWQSDPSAYWNPVPATTVYYSLGNEQAAATVAAAVPGSRVERIAGLGETIQVVLASDFTAVNYPQASGTPVSVYATQTGNPTPTRLPGDLNVTNGADVTCD